MLLLSRFWLDLQLEIDRPLDIVIVRVATTAGLATGHGISAARGVQLRHLSLGDHWRLMLVIPDGGLSCCCCRGCVDVVLIVLRLALAGLWLLHVLVVVDGVVDVVVMVLHGGPGVLPGGHGGGALNGGHILLDSLIVFIRLFTYATLLGVVVLHFSGLSRGGHFFDAVSISQYVRKSGSWVIARPLTITADLLLEKEGEKSTDGERNNLRLFFLLPAVSKPPPGKNER